MRDTGGGGRRKKYEEEEVKARENSFLLKTLRKVAGKTLLQVPAEERGGSLGEKRRCGRIDWQEVCWLVVSGTHTDPQVRNLPCISRATGKALTAHKETRRKGGQARQTSCTGRPARLCDLCTRVTCVHIECDAAAGLHPREKMRKTVLDRKGRNKVTGTALAGAGHWEDLLSCTETL